MSKSQLLAAICTCIFFATSQVTSAASITSSGVSGSCTSDASSCDIDVLAGASFNAVFDDGESGDTYAFNLNNTSTTTLAVTLAVTSVNQGGSNWGFTDGVTLSSSAAGVGAIIAEGVNWTDSYTFNIAANASETFDWSFGQAYASGFAKPDIDFAVYASPIPVPAAGWLFASGLLGLVSIARRKSA